MQANARSFPTIEEYDLMARDNNMTIFAGLLNTDRRCRVCGFNLLFSYIQP